MRQIEGTLNKLLAYRDLLGDQVDEQSVGRAVRDMLQKSNEYIPSPSVIGGEKTPPKISPHGGWGALDKVEKQMRTDPAFAEVVKEIATNINAKR